ncbi:hypothetical protein AVEN_23980-1 [Araneus ventricosus]|uniref:Uncharacterized protein n=1 Tax=Araneus ventricosus TaxID=182803 RepID=A0A4Y2D1J0_ARAVE|nr:hypothetical protein AVEN_23980-1 [Araneus ventricosus]
MNGYFSTVFVAIIGPRCPGGKSLLQGRRAQASKPYSSKDQPCLWTWFTLHLTERLKRSPSSVARKFGKREGASLGVVHVILSWLKFVKSFTKQPSCCFKNGTLM